MKKSWHLNSVWLLTVAGLAAFSVIIVLRNTMPPGTYVYGFIFNFLPIQFINTWLFIGALFLTAARYGSFYKEAEVSQSIRIADFNVAEKDARYLLEQIPEQYKSLAFFQRIREILKAYLYREDVMRLNEELARRDYERVARGHLILNSFRQIIPVVGFLGTVIGLSKGMAKFPEISSKAGRISELKEILRSFSQDLSVAFDTTLLALAYTIVIILLIAFLRGKEENHAERINSAARELILRMQAVQDQENKENQKLPEKLLQTLQKSNSELVNVLNTTLENGFLTRLEGILKEQKQ